MKELLEIEHIEDRHLTNGWKEHSKSNGVSIYT